MNGSKATQALVALLIVVGPGSPAAAWEVANVERDLASLARRVDYKTAIHQRRRTFQRLQRVFGEHRVRIGEIKVPIKNPAGEQETLTIPWCRILSRNAAVEQKGGEKGHATFRERVRLITEGNHGIEGGPWLKLADSELNALADAGEKARIVNADGTTAGLAELPDDLGLMVMGPLNPEGMLYRLRTDLALRDTNRTWWPTLAAYPHLNEAYEKMVHILNPGGPAKYHDWTHPPYLLPLLWRLGVEAGRARSLAGGETVLRAGTLQGQFRELERGMFWIGDTTVPIPRNEEVKRVLQQQIGDAAAIIGFDGHTGFGRLGHVSVVAPERPEAVMRFLKPLLETVKGNLKVGDAKLRGGFYPMEGSFISYLAGLFPDKVVLPYILEIGTVEGPQLPPAAVQRIQRAGLGVPLDLVHELVRNIQSLQWMKERHRAALHSLLQREKGIVPADQWARDGFASKKDQKLIMPPFEEMFDFTRLPLWEATVGEVNAIVPGMMERFVNMDLPPRN